MPKKMSRRNRDRDNFSWTKPAPKASTIPKGLRGRNIGFYFRDQQKKKTRPHRDYIVNLTIPPAVITVIENDIKSIKDLAKESNILIPQFTGLNLVRKDIKTEECDFSSDIGLTTNSEEMYSSFNDDLNSPSTSSSYKSYEAKDIKIKTESIENSTIEYTDAATAITKTIENVKTEPLNDTGINVESSSSSNERIFSLRGAGDFKYGYEDIITGTFDEKLNECLSKGLAITKKSLEVDKFCVKLQEDYKRMINMPDYKKFKQFRETLPTYKKSTELLEVINNNQVIVISGETGCGKSTQVPQLILDEAINNSKGGYVNILVTQPRRIAASSLAMRVAQERSEPMGDSVGYAVRLEKVDARSRGSIMFMTTGILLTTLEVDQALSNYTHVILDEVHERTCQIDLAMSMLKKVLPKRKELKVILMSATIDADTLSQYFDNCPMLHIEGLAYPVQDVYLEEILDMTKYRLPFVDNNRSRNNKKYKRKKLANEMEKEIQYRAEIAPWLESVKNQLSRDVYLTLQDHRIEEMNMDLMLELLLYICNGPPGAILIFLPGIVDISKLLGAMQNSKSFPSSHFYIYPLHSKLPSLEQHKIFERPPPHVRKIIVATNIAETSITIDDIVYVIDCGRMKYSGLNIETNVATLATEWIAQANLRQRRGRAGRCQPGMCFHLLSTGRANLLQDRILPEIQRDSLLEPVLTIKRLRLGKAAEALKMLPSPPADTTIRAAVKHLQQCGALNYLEKLNPLGWHLARLPVHPAAGKLLLLGSLFGCLNRAASVAAVWGFKDPFQLVIGKEDEVDAAKRNFSLGGGSDHIAISEAIIRWENKSNYEKRNYAYHNFLSNNTLELLSDMKRQLGDNLKQMGFLPSGDITSPWENRNKDNLTLFKAIVAAALYPNVATAKWVGLRNRNPHKKPVRVKGRTENGVIHIHPSSVIADKRPRRGVQAIPICSNPGANWIVYWRQQRSTQLYLLEVTLVQTLPLLFFGELTVTEGANSDECYISITTVKVCSKIHTTELLIQLRGLLDQVLASKIGISSTHATIHNPFEEKVLNAVIQLITAEEEQSEYPDYEDPSESDNSEFDQTGFEDDVYI